MHTDIYQCISVFICGFVSSLSQGLLPKAQPDGFFKKGV